MDNSLFVIFPYKYECTWVFDDPSVNLVKEPFVFGIPEMINELVIGIPDSHKGFKLIFSANPFPKYQAKLTWVKEECEGNWYTINGKEKGWLCPALYKYFKKTPCEIYIATSVKF